MCLGADHCQDVQLTLTWKKNPDRIKKNFFFFKHANIFHILAGVVEAGPGGNLEKLIKTYVVLNRQLHLRFG